MLFIFTEDKLNGHKYLAVADDVDEAIGKFYRFYFGRWDELLRIDKHVRYLIIDGKKFFIQKYNCNILEDVIEIR